MTTRYGMYEERTEEMVSPICEQCGGSDFELDEDATITPGVADSMVVCTNCGTVR